jgi:hypothetical protein
MEIEKEVRREGYQRKSIAAVDLQGPCAARLEIDE